MNDDELRSGLRSLAARAANAPVPEIGLIRRRAHRRFRRNAVAGAAAIAVLAIAAALIIPRALGARPTPITVGPSHAGWIPPRSLPAPDAGPASAPFFVNLDSAKRTAPAVISRVDLANTAIPVMRRIAAVSPPVHGMVFTGIAAAADDRTFVLVGTSSLPGRTSTSYFELRLRPDGRPYPLIRLAISAPLPPSSATGDIALTANGSRLAITAGSGGNAVIEVISLATGTARSWSAPGTADSVSWISDGELAVLWRPAGRSGLTIRVLDTSAADSDLLGASRKLVGASPHAGLFHRLAAGQITATTRYVFALVSRPLAGGGPGNQVGIAAFSASTGAPSGVVNQFPQTGMGSYCGVLWTDRSGQRLVTSCGGSAGLMSGHRFTELGPRGFSLWSIYKNVPIAW